MPLMVDGSRVVVTERNGGVLNTSQFARVAGVVMDNTVSSFPSVTNVDRASMTVQNNGRLSFPLIKSISKTDGCYDVYWRSYDAGSVLDLSGVTNIYGGNCGGIHNEAYSGGSVVLSNLVSVTGGGYMTAYVDGAGCVIDLRKLASYTNTADYFYLEARNAAQVIMPLMADGGRVRLTVRNGGVLDTAQFWRLASVTVDNSVLSLTGTTNLDGSSLYVYNGGTLTLPVLQSVTKPAGCYDADWQLNQAGSRIIAPALTSIVSGNCGTFYFRAFTGSQLILSNLTSISDGSVTVLSDGTGTVVDLTKLNSFIAPNGQSSSLTAQNSGVILLGAQAFLLANVNVNIPPGNPFLPPSFISGPNLTLYGTPWHSYLIENRTTLVPNADWQFFLHVPLTNVFQQVSGSPAANAAYRVSEFIPNPGQFDFFRPTTNLPMIVFYSPTNQTYQILTTTNLANSAAWTTSSAVTMSNTFRILSPVSSVERERYFRARTP